MEEEPLTRAQFDVQQHDGRTPEQERIDTECQELHRISQAQGGMIGSALLRLDIERFGGRGWYNED